MIRSILMGWNDDTRSVHITQSNRYFPHQVRVRRLGVAVYCSLWCLLITLRFERMLGSNQIACERVSTFEKHRWFSFWRFVNSCAGHVIWSYRRVARRSRSHLECPMGLWGDSRRLQNGLISVWKPFTASIRSMKFHDFSNETTKKIKARWNPNPQKKIEEKKCWRTISVFGKKESIEYRRRYPA